MYPSNDPPHQPAEAAAPATPITPMFAPAHRPLLPKWAWAVVLLVVAVVMAVAGIVATLVANERAEKISAQIEKVAFDLHAQHMQTMRSLDVVSETVEDIEISVPPNNDKLFTILSKGVGVTEYELRVDDVGTTPEAAFATDLTTTPYNQQTDAYTQEFTILNTHATQNLCWKPIAWSTAGATCTLKCAGVVATLTCSAATTDGARLTPGQAVTRRLDGTSCVCVVGSAAGTNYQTERVVR